MFVHSSRFAKQFEYLKLKGIDTEPLLKQVAIKPEELTNPEKTFDFEQYLLVLEFALRQTNDENYGLKFGNEPHLAGTIGMMSASCTNLMEAFLQGLKFLKLQGDFATLSFIDDENSPKLVYELAQAWTLKHALTAKLEVDAMFSFLSLILKLNSNGTLKPKRVHLICEKPANSEEYKNIFGVEPEFNCEYNELVFNKQDLLIPMKAFNPETFNVLKIYLENQLKSIQSNQTTGDKVRTILLSSMQYQFPDIETVADKLKTTARTLQRQLSDENTSFSNILKETRTNLAKELLRKNDLSISEISYTLGYSDLGNFSRSFKKITGQSPQEFRQG